MSDQKHNTTYLRKNTHEIVVLFSWDIISNLFSSEMCVSVCVCEGVCIGVGVYGSVGVYKCRCVCLCVFLCVFVGVCL